MKILKRAACVVIPLLAGFLAALILTSGVTSRWQMVSSPTGADLALFDAPKDPQGYPQAVQVCDTSSIEFSILANKPKQMTDCVQSIYYGIDGSERTILAHDGQGNVWKWRFMDTAIKQMGWVFWPVVGFVLGVVLWIIVIAADRSKRKKSAKQ